MTMKNICLNNQVPIFNFDLRKSQSQGGPRIDFQMNPITHLNDQNSTNKGKNLFYHQQEERNEVKRKQKMF
jgi:hypothetical protein